ncbi:MAG: hypothetical protein IKX97_01015 [Erysipelotrichaceae bacterium]|nr:hypothetical protein [Erysipelotrichaceae bacterium]
MKKKKTILLIIILFLIALSGLFLYTLMGKPDIGYQILNQDDDSVIIAATVNDKSLIDRNYYIAVDNYRDAGEDTEWHRYDPEKTYDLEPGNWYIHVKDSLNRVYSSDALIDSTIAIKLTDLEYPFYPIGDRISLGMNVLTYGNDEDLSVTSSNENVAYVQDGYIVTKGVGTSTITVSSHGLSDSIDIEVTDLYTLIDTDSMS